MRARLIALNPEPVDLPFDAAWQPRPFGHVACTVVETDDPEQLRLRLLEVASGGVITGPLAEEPARLVMMDVDSTLTTTEAIDLLAEHAGTGELVASITERAMRGELDFAESLRERVATLQGLPVRVFDEVLPRITLSPGARELVAALHEAGVRVGVTSGGFTALVAPSPRNSASTSSTPTSSRSPTGYSPVASTARSSTKPSKPTTCSASQPTPASPRS